MTKQDYGTPRVFLDAVEARFGALTFDLATDGTNAKAPRFFTEEENALSKNWALELEPGNWWLNPPFNDIATWAAKCTIEIEACGKFAAHLQGDTKIFFLTPASIGSNWFADHVHGRAVVLGLSPRMTFDGTPPNKKTGKIDPYPKDLMLSIFSARHFPIAGLDCWRWKS